MSRIEVATVIEATPDEVWSCVEDLSSHVEWMDDAHAITFVGDQRAGVGTEMLVDTRVGPLRLEDRMEVTEWEPGRAMGVRHVGLVTGSGRFTLAPVPGGGTEFTWAEDLRFPWWMGGPLGGVVGSRVLELVWRRNLRSLKKLVERPDGG
ncbi:MAG: SRPBCC family protein [Actinomycetota bacterium]|nr:SRPBCC family protein [Actinomycetota bacterium]